MSNQEKNSIPLDYPSDFDEVEGESGRFLSQYRRDNDVKQGLDTSRPTLVDDFDYLLWSIIWRSFKFFCEKCGMLHVPLPSYWKQFTNGQKNFYEKMELKRKLMELVKNYKKTKRKYQEEKEKLKHWEDKVNGKHKEAPESKKMGEINKKTLPAIFINLNYLDRKRKQCVEIINKEFGSIMNPQDEEITLLYGKMDKIGNLYERFNRFSPKDQLRTYYDLKMKQLSKKIFDITEHKDFIKEDLIEYYLNGINSMVRVYCNVQKQVKRIGVNYFAKVKYKKIYKILIKTRWFIGRQILALEYVLNVLLNTNGTQHFYIRNRIARRIEALIIKIKSIGFKADYRVKYLPKKKSKEAIAQFKVPIKDFDPYSSSSSCSSS